jgi:hypothetical protein
MNVHSDIQKLLSAYCSNDLSVQDRATVDAHLQECSLCRADLADLQATLQLIRMTPEVEPPPWLTSRIMANLRDQQSTQRSWLSRLFFPLHIKIPLELMALLVVCISGYYLTQTVETELKSARTLQETPADSAVEPARTVPQAGKPQQKKLAEPPATLQTREKSDSATPAQPPVTPKQAGEYSTMPSAAAPAFEPSPPASKREHGAPAAGSFAEPSKDSQAVESIGRSLEAAPSMKKKAIRSGIRPEPDNLAPAPAGKAAERAFDAYLPEMTLNLTVTDRAIAADAVRAAGARSGAVVIDDTRMSAGRITVRVQSARLQDFINQLVRLGRLDKQPAPPDGQGILEVTVQW